MEYMLIEAESAAELEKAVDRALAEDWRPCGGVSVGVVTPGRWTSDGDWIEPNLTYVQAMTGLVVEPEGSETTDAPPPG